MQALIVDSSAPLGVKLVNDYPRPTPEADEVLIRPRLAGICSTDLEIARGYMGFTGVPGHEFVGVVEEGADHLIGKRVVGEINCICGECDMCRRGLGTHCRNRTTLGIAGRDGVFAEVFTLPARNCCLVPDNVSDEQAVFVEPLAAAAQVVRHCAIDERMRVAVLGTGRLGLLIAQVLVGHYCEPTVIGRNPKSLALCRDLGLIAKNIDDVEPMADHDIVIEATGSPDGLRLAMRMIRPMGTIVLKSTYAGSEPIDLSPIVINEVRVIGNRCGPFPDALRMLEGRKAQVEPLISAVYPLSDAERAFEAAQSPENIKVLIRSETTS